MRNIFFLATLHTMKATCKHYFIQYNMITYYLQLQFSNYSLLLTVFYKTFKIKFLTNRNDDTIHTRLLQQWQYITQDCSWSCMYMYVLLINIGITCTKGICSQVLIESSIDTQSNTPLTHWADTP